LSVLQEITGTGPLKRAGDHSPGQIKFLNFSDVNNVNNVY